jgi:hypothetical protein
MASYLANPILVVQLAFSRDRAIPSWANKVAWKLVSQKSHCPLGKEKGFFVGFENLGNLPLSPLILECELKFLDTIFGYLRVVVMGRFFGRNAISKPG